MHGERKRRGERISKGDGTRKGKETRKEEQKGVMRIGKSLVGGKNGEC